MVRMPEEQVRPLKGFHTIDDDQDDGHGGDADYDGHDGQDGHHVDDDNDADDDNDDDNINDQERLVIAAIGESGEGKSAFLNLVFFTIITITIIITIIVNIIITIIAIITITITLIIIIIIIRQNTWQVLNSPGERKKFLEESELPELCTTQPRVHEV